MTSPASSYSHPNRLGGPSTASHSSPASPRPLPPTQACAVAALSRSLGGASLGAGDGEDPQQCREKRDWLRILHDELLPKATTQQALKTLEVLVKLMSGVLALPADSNGQERERTVSTRNSTIKTNVVDVAGAYDLLIQSGFRRKVIDFEKKLTFPLLPSASDNATLLSRLHLGHSILLSALESAQSAEALERTRKDAAQMEKERRMRGVLEDIKEDREMVQKREERERERRRRVREAREIRETAVREASEWDRA